MNMDKDLLNWKPITCFYNATMAETFKDNCTFETMMNVMEGNIAATSKSSSAPPKGPPDITSANSVSDLVEDDPDKDDSFEIITDDSNGLITEVGNFKLKKGTDKQQSLVKELYKEISELKKDILLQHNNNTLKFKEIECLRKENAKLQSKITDLQKINKNKMEGEINALQFENATLRCELEKASVECEGRIREIKGNYNKQLNALKEKYDTELSEARERSDENAVKYNQTLKILRFYSEDRQSCDDRLKTSLTDVQSQLKNKERELHREKINREKVTKQLNEVNREKFEMEKQMNSIVIEMTEAATDN